MADGKTYQEAVSHTEIMIKKAFEVLRGGEGIRTIVVMDK